MNKPSVVSRGRPAGMLVIPAGLACALLLAAAAWWGSSSSAGKAAALAAPPSALPESLAAPRTPVALPLERASASATPLVVSDEMEQEVARKPKPRGSLKERDFHQEFLLVGRKDLAALERSAWEVLGSPGPDAEKVGMLRAVQELSCPQRSALFAHAALELPMVVKGGNVSVPWFAVNHLGRHAAGDAAARAALHEVAWSRAGPVPVELRRMAAASLAAHGTLDDLRRLDRELNLEQDEQVRAAAGAALASHPDPKLADWLRQRLDLPEPAAVEAVGSEEE